MNYDSFLPINYKKGLVDILLFRAYNICTDYPTLYNDLKTNKTNT